MFFDNGQANEGRAYVYHGSSTGLSTTADWILESDQADARLGSSVACAGDVNDDGYSDVIVGALGYDNGQTNEGRAFVFHGSASGLSMSAAWTGESNQQNGLYGACVSTAGDVNGDGYSDVIVGAYQYESNPFFENNEGRTYVYHGSALGLSSSAAWTAESNQAGAFFGWAVSTAGDVNDDGYSDIIVGAYLYDNGQTDEGRVYVYHGTSSGLNSIAAWTKESNQADSRFGISVCTAGDVNGDDYSDVIIGSPWYDNPSFNEGRVSVYHGSSSGLSASADWLVEGGDIITELNLGHSVSTAGDVNDDGYSDVLIGSPGWHLEEEDDILGRASLYEGSASGLGGAASSVFGDQHISAYGIVANAGDVNGDGFDDVIVSAYSYTNGQADEGRVFVHYGED
jgi:hypothetical protein